MARIPAVGGGCVWDARGRPTVEAEVTVGRGTTRLATGRAIAPIGASTGSREAKSLEASAAVKNVNTLIRSPLRALSVSDQKAIDQRLIDPPRTSHQTQLHPHPTPPL